MATGCLYLASIWKAAWVAGNGNAKVADDVADVAIDTEKLRKLYGSPLELVSKHLDTVDEVLT